MSEKDDGKFGRSIVVSTAGAAVTALVVAAAKSVGLPDAVAAGLAVTGPSMFKIVGEAYERQLERRSTLASVGFAASAGDDDKALRQLEDAKKEPSFEVVMFETYRNMVQAVDDAVVPALGMLAGEYRFGGVPPDHFFRGLGRLLCELDAADFAAFRKLVRAVAEQTDTVYDGETIVACRLNRAVRDARPVATVQKPPEKWRTLVEIEPAVAERLFHLMRTNRIGKERDYETLGMPEDANVTWQLSIATAKRMARIVDPVTSGATRSASE